MSVAQEKKSPGYQKPGVEMQYKLNPAKEWVYLQPYRGKRLFKMAVFIWLRHSSSLKITRARAGIQRTLYTIINRPNVLNVRKIHIDAI